MQTPGSYASNVAVRLEMDKQMAESAQKSTSFIKSTIIPKNALIIPPYLLTPASQGFQFVVDGRIKILNDSTYTNLWVGTQSGLILHFPKRGCNSVWHCGFVLKVATALSIGSPFVPITGMITTVTFNKTLAVPFDDDTQDITISPNPGAQFNRGRVISGALEIMSNAVPITGNSLAFTGTGAYGRIGDTRDLAQNNQNGNVFDPTDIATMSLTTKDGDNNTSVTDGCVMLVGADIGDNFDGPNADRSIQRYPAQYVQAISDLTGVNSATFGSAAAGTQFPVISIWYSPWDISAAQSAVSVTVAGQYQQFIKGGAIDEGGICEFNLSGLINCQSANNLGSVLQVAFSATHLFTKAQSPQNVGASNMTFATIVEQQEFTTALNANTPQRYFSFAFRPGERYYTTDVYSKGLGKYLGTMFNVSYTRLTNPGAEGNVVWGFQSASLIVQSPTTLRPGWVGPCHLYRWDDVADGQEFRLSGVLNGQMLPTGNIQPYSRQAMQDTAAVTDVNVLPLLDWVYNSDVCPVSTMWTLTGYKQFVTTFMPNWSTQTLLTFIAQDARTPQILSSLSLQAGLLDDVVKAGTGLYNAFKGAGQFGAMRGAGQFGALNQVADVRAGLLRDAAGQAMNAGFLGDVLGGASKVASLFGAAGQFGAQPNPYAAAGFAMTGRRLRDEL